MADHNVKPLSERFIDVLQTGCFSLAPLLLVRFVDTSDRTLDNVLITTATGLISVLLTFVFIWAKDPLLVMKMYGKCLAFVIGKQYVSHGFLATTLPVMDTLSAEGKRVPVYVTMLSKYTTDGINLLIWLNKNVLVAEYKPRLEFSTLEKQVYTNFAGPYNKDGRCYPFYYVNDDTIYWELACNTSSSQAGRIRFSATSIQAMDQFLVVLGDAGFHKFGNTAITRCNEQKTTTRVLAAYTFNAGGKSDKSSVGDGMTFDQNRTFDSLFFKDKEYALALIDKFKVGRLYPKHVASCNKLGILLHGPPGTGKSAFVIGLANSLQRHILVVDMSTIKTCECFNALMNQTKSNYVLFLEEMDCVLGVIKKRGGGTGSHSDDSDEKNDEYNQLMAMYINTSEKEQKQKVLDQIDEYKARQKDKLHLGHILQRLDGIYDETDRVIIGCTNHPDLIDPALLRPGRLGIQLEMGLCTHKMIVDIITHYLELTPEERTTLNKNTFPEGFYSPADLIQRIQKVCIFDESRDDSDDKGLSALIQCIQSGS